jgi:hypothetical protein
MRGWAYKNKKKRGIRGSEDKGNEGNGSTLCTRAGPSSLSRADPSCVTFFILVFSPGCQCGVGPAVPLACRYSVYAGPDSVCSSLSYLPVHQHSLLDLSPCRYSLLTAETVPADGNSMA